MAKDGLNRIAFIMGTPGPHLSSLTQRLEASGFRCVITDIGDEIEQAGLQTKKVILIFSDANYAYKFLMNVSWIGFDTFRVLYLPSQPRMSDDTREKLGRVGLRVSFPEKAAELLKSLTDFDNGVEEEISFAVFEGDKK